MICVVEKHYDDHLCWCNHYEDKGHVQDSGQVGTAQDRIQPEQELAPQYRSTCRKQTHTQPSVPFLRTHVEQ